MDKKRFYIITFCCLMLLYGCGEDNQDPYMPEVVEPEDGSLVSLDVTLRWIGEDPDGDALTYDVYLKCLKCTDVPPETWTSYLGIRVTWQSQISTWYKPGSFLKYGNSYQWSVIARDNLGGQSPVLSSTFIVAAPPVLPVSQ